ncbi:S8 family serine peptidase [uncultured Proteiniphilum sp.]|uniref:S8 family peptidase n=1 Tax=uncultured Proteiniphilum sp. TaxID=497637 RepID=UPI0026152C98|nr:S8 family serine peptidase [uncultured Proteiniphilum sp.]
MSKNRYIVLLNDQNQSSIQNVEKEFSVSITSSENLSKENRSFDIIDNYNAVLYKNLGAVVVDDVDEHQLTRSLIDNKSPIVYFEKERDFFPADEMVLIDGLKVGVDQLKNKILELEDFIRKKPIPQTSLTELEWGLKAIGIGETQFSGKGVDVCILDTGFDVLHPDFADREIEGKSFIEGEDWNKDPNGHGTHCAGIACGNVRNDTGKRYGIAKDCNLKIGKVLSDSGKGTTGSIIDAIDWAITKKFRIISLSLASPVKLNEKPSLLFEVVGNRALENNCLIIAAAGNDSKRPSLPVPVSAPANSLSIMAVAAIDNQMRIARFSNAGINAGTGGNINVCAPGVDILSSYSRKNGSFGNYVLLSGTSMATPHVSGLAALYMEQFPEVSAKEIWELLESRAKPIEGLKYRDIGKGLIQAIH